VATARSQVSVTVEISCTDLLRRIGNLQISLRLKSAIPIAKKQADRTFGGIRNGQIQLLIAVEIPHGDGVRVASRLVKHGWLHRKAAPRRAQHHADIEPVD
jgi:hypothetical protein